MTNDNKPDTSAAIAPVLETQITLKNGCFICEWRFIDIPPRLYVICYVMKVERNPELIVKRLFNN